MSSNSTITPSTVSAGSAKPRPGNFNPYHYVPSEGVAITMIVLFGLSTLMHTGQATRSRLWYLLPTVALAGVLEVMGWAARLWSHYDVKNMTPYQIQTLCTVLGPTPLLAANFVIFGNIISNLGTHYSRITPKYYTIIFCSSDVISLLVQGAGGALAAKAVASGGNIELGSRIMLAGIIFQLLVIIVFVACAIEYLVRYLKGWPLRPIVVEVEKQGERKAMMTQSVKIMLGGLTFNTLCLVVRAVYRVVELAEGWGGPIMRVELYFNVLEGTMIVLAIYTMNFIHPSYFLKFN